VFSGSNNLFFISCACTGLVGILNLGGGGGGVAVGEHLNVLWHALRGHSSGRFILTKLE
jgi:hypothetical protein